MDDALFVANDVMTVLVDFIGQYTAAGVGIAFIGWVLGYVIYFVIDALKY